MKEANPIPVRRQRGATIIPFPMVNRLAKVRSVANGLKFGSDRARAAFWKRTVNDIKRQMRAAGIKADVIEMEIAAFFDAVEAELTAGQMEQNGR